MKNDYYVYSYYRLDINEPFYVGKGHGNRWKRIDKGSRGYNKHFMNIVEKHPIAVVIEKDNLTEKEAFYWEEEIIKQLVFEYGFSIEINDCNSTDHYCHLVNRTWGGEGASKPISEEQKQFLKEIHTGLKASEETKIKMSEIQKVIQNKPEIKKMKSERMKGESNPMYGKNPRDYMSEETKEELRKRQSEANSGENNPMYGKKRTQEEKEKISKTRKEREIGKGASNYNATPVICITTGEIFDCITDTSSHFNPASISACCRGIYKSAGILENGTKLVWMYLKDYEKATKEELERKINEANKPKGRKVICVTTNIIFNTAKEAGEYYDVLNTGITACCKGRQKSAGKLPDGTRLVWMYLEDYRKVGGAK